MQATLHQATLWTLPIALEPFRRLEGNISRTWHVTGKPTYIQTLVRLKDPYGRRDV